jgi:hypothetical protein
VNRRELDFERLQRRDEAGDELLEAPDLDEAVADPAG